MIRKFSIILTALMILFPCAFTHAKPETENEKALALFEQLFNEQTQRNPEFQTYLGQKENYDKWNNISLKRETDDYQFSKKQLARLYKLDPKKLDQPTTLSYQLFEKQLQDSIAAYPWRHYNYPVNQMFGVQSNIPSLLINMHKIQDKKDAQDYIARLEAVPEYIAQLIEGLAARKKEKLLAPKFVYPMVISDCENLLTGYPFANTEVSTEGSTKTNTKDSTKDSTLMADFRGKVNALTLDEKEKQQLIKKTEIALTNKLGPAYKKLIAYLKELEASADTRDGVWKFPNGEKFYEFALQQTTTTNMTANEIHELGLREVARIRSEMQVIVKSVGFTGDLKSFFDFLLKDPKFQYPNTAEGKQAYLAKATDIINTMKASLDRIFIVKPKAELLVKAVEPFREESAGAAFYEGPAPDGSRPGTYYANLYNMAGMPIYNMEALAYHEGIPGHHMQISIAQELKETPTFRKYVQYTAYVEGWGLYSELIPKEIGFYKDPYSDFGRLNLELWRAARLVLDTGIHAKRWTREQAIQYLIDNTPTNQEDATKAIERYIVMPSQATAYKIGMLKILQLRTRSQQALGDAFDIREFHDVILKNGAVPLDVLEDLVNVWIKQNIKQKTETETEKTEAVK
jgi:uncharacterized protein (DUF885 family)